MTQPSDQAHVTPKSQPPRSVSQTPPMIDHSFTLQAIMEVQKSIGSMSGKLDAVCDRVDRLEGRIGKLEETVSGVTHKIYAATAILTLLVAVGAFMVDKAWDIAMKQIEAKADATSTQTNTAK